MTPNANLHVCIRWLVQRDVPAVLAVERACFEYAWTEQDFRRCLKLPNCVGMVAEEGRTIVGFMVFKVFRPRVALLNLAVDPHRRRRGIGGRMLGQLILKASGYGHDRITLAVRETNLGAQRFFRAQGFRATGVLRGYYEDSGEDAYRMVYRLVGTDALRTAHGPFPETRPNGA
ncbi:MAG TPA: ribosomal protein S18-alanine N-acetyltransferase [Gemmataceae bacterium]|jgi:ribosomal-protein-alanine N-acetyltransferase|nr:ribosomal protein S18-alanine N-acetyltransferase [Gemmataceae bacterium]